MHHPSRTSESGSPPEPRSSDVLRIEGPARDRLDECSRLGYPDEACGLLVGRRRHGRPIVEEITHGRNLEVERPHERFTLDPVHLMEVSDAAEARGREVLGVWHTHPERPAVASARDLEYAQPGWVYVIVSLIGGSVADIRAWTRNGETIEERAIDRGGLASAPAPVARSRSETGS